MDTAWTNLGSRPITRKPEMNMKSLLVSFVIAFGSASLAQATPVSASYTTSGSAGNWTYDLTLTNNTGNQYLYFVGADVAGGKSSGTPSDFSLNSPYAFGDVSYSAAWIGVAAKPLPPSTTLSGFKITSTAQTAQASINMFAYGHNYGIAYEGSDYLGGLPTRPVFAFTAQRVVSTDVPEPASLALLGLGLAAICVGRRRSR